MAFFRPRKKTSHATRVVGKGGDIQKLHLHVSSPRIVMFQFLKGTGQIAKFAIILCLLALIVTGAYRGLQHLFLGNEKYVLQEIKLTSNGKLSHARIVKAADIDLGANIFAINIDKIQASLEVLPEVISCDVERRLPGVLQINITERIPVAWIESQTLQFPGRANGGILADKNGTTFPCEGNLWQTAQHLPTIAIHGAKKESFQHGEKMNEPDIIRALHLIAAFNEQDIRAEWLPRRIVLLNSYSMEVTCHDNSNAVFGMYDHQRQLNDFVSIREHTLKTSRDVEHVNLIPKINIPVKFAGADAAIQQQNLTPIFIQPADR